MEHENELQQILDKYAINADARSLLGRWNEGHRHYHNETHLRDLLRMIKTDKANGSIKTETEYEQLVLAALFHDIIYRPGRGDNEEESARFFLECCGNPNQPVLREVYQAIVDTKTHVATIPLSERFNRYDMNIVERSFEELVEWEKGIYEEYKRVGTTAYKMGRLGFLRSLVKAYPHNKGNLERLMEYVENGQ